MARIRSIKPEFFRHAELYELERECGLPVRIAFAGLWTCADREGRFRWKPRELKLDCLPHDDLDFSRVLDALITRGFIVRYAVDGVEYGYIPSWHDHQVINNRESASKLPSPENAEESNTPTREPREPLRVTHAPSTPLKHAQGEVEGKGREGNLTEQERLGDSSTGEPPAPAAPVPPKTFPKTDDPRVQSLHGIAVAAKVNARLVEVQQWVCDGVTESQLLASIAKAKGKKPQGHVLNAGFVASMFPDFTAPEGRDPDAVMAQFLANRAAEDANATH